MCTLQQRGRLFLLTLTGDGEHRLNHGLIDSIRSALSTVGASATRDSAFVTSAEGRFFSNGLDLPWANSAPSPSAARSRLSSMVSRFAPLLADFASLPIPTVAAVTGHAAAGGFVLALCHDYTLMREDRGFLYTSEVDIGFPYPPYLMSVVRSKIGDPIGLRDVALRGKRIKGAEAAEWGIVDQVLSGAAETLEAAIRLGEELAG